jgi:hypothetical protein
VIAEGEGRAVGGGGEASTSALVPREAMPPPPLGSAQPQRRSLSRQYNFRELAASVEPAVEKRNVDSSFVVGKKTPVKKGHNKEGSPTNSGEENREQRGVSEVR